MSQSAKKPTAREELELLAKTLANSPPRKIDWNDPITKEIVENTRREQDKILARMNLDYRQLEARVTI